MLETAFTKALNVVLLQRHQNVGELRLHAPNVLKSVRNCRVTRMLVSYDSSFLDPSFTAGNCRVTRMLVSYDISTVAVYPTAIVLPSKCRFVTKLQ